MHAGSSHAQGDAVRESPHDSLAAMEAFTKLAAKRDEQRGEQEAKTPLLNETSFDRRRTMAVYKQDGNKGHHMQVMANSIAAFFIT